MFGAFWLFGFSSTAWLHDLLVYPERNVQIFKKGVGFRRKNIAQSAGAVEYTHCFSAEG